MREIQKQKMSKNIFHAGFTLVEILIVIAVIGILAAITATSYNGAQQRGYDVAILSDADAMDGALSNLSLNSGGKLDLGETGYFYSDAAYETSDANGKQVLDDLNAKLDFKPTKGNSIDVKLTDDDKEYCVRVFNEKSRNHFSIGTAVRVVSSKNVDIGNGVADSCDYVAGGQPTVYSGGAVPGAREDILSTSGTFNVDSNAVRLDIAVIGPGGSGNGYCGGGGGAYSTAIINSPASSYTVTIGQASAAGTNGGKGTASSFGPITSVGGNNAGSGCGVLSLGVPGGVASPTSGGVSQKYGPSVNGGNGGAYLTLGLLAIAPGGGATGGGGYGASSNLINGGAGGTGAWGNGGGGGGGTLLGLCSSPGSGGKTGGDYPGQSGTACDAATNPGSGGAGNAGGGGGGKSNVGGGVPGKGGDGLVRVLTCFTQTCNPISTPLP